MRDKSKKEKTVKKHEIDMVNGPILKKMLVFSLPLMLSSIMQMLFNATDIVVLGQFVGDHSLAAVGSTSSLINLLTNLFLGLSVGANVLVGKYFGGRKMQQLNEAIHTAVTISAASGVLLAVIGFIAAEPILRLMQTPEDLVGLAALYMRVLFFGMPSMMLYNFGSAILRAKGDTKRPLFFLLAAGVTNVVLDLVFVIIFNMSVAGVAAATAIAQTLSAVLVTRCLFKEEEGFRLSFKKLGVNKEHFHQHPQGGPALGLSGRSVRSFQCRRAGLDQLLWRCDDGRQRGSQQSGELRLFWHECLLPGGDFVYEPERRRLQIRQGQADHDQIGGLCGGDWSGAGQSGLHLWAHSAGHLYGQPRCHRRGHDQAGGDLYYVCALRHDGYHGRRDERSGLFDRADDRLAGGSLRT